jgi:hypothetical protein
MEEYNKSELPSEMSGNHGFLFAEVIYQTTLTSSFFIPFFTLDNQDFKAIFGLVFKTTGFSGNLSVLSNP